MQNNFLVHLSNGESIRCAPLEALPQSMKLGRPVVLSSVGKHVVWDLDRLEWRVLDDSAILSQTELPERYGLI